MVAWLLLHRHVCQGILNSMTLDYNKKINFTKRAQSGLLASLLPIWCIFVFILILGEKGVAYTLMTPTDQNFAGDLVRNLVSKLLMYLSK